MEGAPNMRAETSSEEYLELDAALKGLFESPNMIFGHGTTPELAQQILQGGLETQSADIQSTAVPLFENAKSYAEQAADVHNQISNWAHQDSRAVVLVAVPHMPEGTQGGVIAYMNAVFEDLPEDHPARNLPIYQRNYRIPSAYIAGYVDVETKRFIPNPAFDPQPIQVKPREFKGPMWSAEDTPTEIPQPGPPGKDADIF